jgi:ParB-like chromosome segregation protein Spo0J
MTTVSLRRLADKGEQGVCRDDGNFFRIPPTSLLEEPGFNLRNYEDPEVIAHIETLATVYIDGGYMPPISVRVGDDRQIYVVDGHCRRRALLLAIERGAPITHAQCLSIKANDMERIELMLRSGDGLKYKPVEVAQGYLRFVRMGLKPVEIAARVKKSISHVEGMLLLATANSDVQNQVRDGKVSATTAVVAVRAHGEKAGAMIEKSAAKAIASGKERVTAGILKARPLPPKVVSKVVESLTQVAASVTPQDRIDISGLKDDDRIAVPVHLYRQMIAIIDTVQEAAAKRSRRAGGDSCDDIEGQDEVEDASPAPDLLDNMAA